jgi:hypothetical protein
MAVIPWASRHGARPVSWLGRMLDRKPLMLVTMALANKMARSIWAMLTKRRIIGILAMQQPKQIISDCEAMMGGM